MIPVVRFISLMIISPLFFPSSSLFFIFTSTNTTSKFFSFMSSPWKSFLIKDILTNQYEVIPSTTNNDPNEFLSRKTPDDRYLSSYPLLFMFQKSNVSKSVFHGMRSNDRCLFCSMSLILIGCLDLFVI